MGDDHGWWVRIGEESYWAPGTATLRSWVSEGRVGRNDLVWDAGKSRWIGSTEVRELQSQFYPFGAITSKWRYDLFLVTWPFLVLLIGAVGVLVIGGSVNAGLLSAVRALSWKETEGRITRSAVLAEDKRMVNGTTLTRYRPDIRYEYRVAGHRYESDSVDFSAQSEVKALPLRTDAERVVAQYSAGNHVTVYFDGAQPASSTLDRGDGLIVEFVMGLVMTAGSTLVLTLWWRRRAAVARSVL